MPKKNEKKTPTAKPTPKETTIDIKAYEKELDKYLEEKKVEVSDEITKKVDDQIEIKISKRMKEQQKKYTRTQKFKLLRRNILILILLGVIGYFGYCLFDVDYFDIRTKVVAPTPSKPETPKAPDTDKPTPSDPSIPDEPSEPIVEPTFDTAYYIENYGYLVASLQIDDAKVFDLYNGKITVDTMSNDLKLKIAYKNLDDFAKNLDNNTISFNSGALKDAAYAILGPNVSLNMELFNYNKTKFIYYNNTFLGAQEPSEKIGLLYEITNAEETNDKLIFEVLVAKLTPENKLANLADNVIMENVYNNEKLSDFKDQLKTYKITFEKTTNAEDYFFESIEIKVS